MMRKAKFLNIMLFLFLGVWLVFSIFFWKGLDWSLLILSLVTGILPSATTYIALRRSKGKCYYSLLVFLIAINTSGTLQKLSYTTKVEKYVYPGERFYEEKLYPQAIKEFRKALEMDRKNIDILEKLKMAYWNNNEIEETIEIQKKIIEIREDLKKDIQLATLYIIDAHKKFFKSKEAIKPGQEFAWDIEIFQKSKSLIYGPEIVGPFSFRANKDGKIKDVRTRTLPTEVENSLNKCEELCQKILRQDKNNESAMTLMTIIKLAHGSYSEAIEYQKTLIKLAPSFGKIVNLGCFYLAAAKEPFMGQQKPYQILIKDVELDYLKEIDKIIEALSKMDIGNKSLARYRALILDVIELYLNLFVKGIYAKSDEKGRRVVDVDFIGNKLLSLSSKIIEREDKNSIAYFYSGEGYLIKKDYASASIQFEIAINACPSDDDLKYYFIAFKSIADFNLNKKNKAPKQIEKNYEIEIISEDRKIHRKIEDVAKDLKMDKSYPILWFGFLDSKIRIKFREVPRNLDLGLTN